MGGYAGDSGDSAPHRTPPQRAPAQRVMDAAPLLGVHTVQFLRREGRGNPAHGQQVAARPAAAAADEKVSSIGRQWSGARRPAPAPAPLCTHPARNFLNDVWVKYDC